jgi:hypothetical protein
MTPRNMDPPDPRQTIFVVERAGCWEVVEETVVRSRHPTLELAYKVALDWASRRFVEGEAVQVMLRLVR